MANRKLLLIGLFCILIFSISAFSQENTKEVQTNDNQITRTENYELNIKNKTISEENYKADVKVATESNSKNAVSLDVGVGVRAKKITVTLTNVTGDVKFRGSLEKLLQRLNLVVEKTVSPIQEDN